MSEQNSNLKNPPRTRSQTKDNPELLEELNRNQELPKSSRKTIQFEVDETQRPKVVHSPILNSRKVIIDSSSDSSKELEASDTLTQQSIFHSTLKSLESDQNLNQTLKKTIDNSIINKYNTEPLADKIFSNNFEESAGTSTNNSTSKLTIQENKSETNTTSHTSQNFSTINNMPIPNNQQVSLRDALEIVPQFDGKNIPLSVFIEGCVEAKSMLPNDLIVEENLTKLIRSKISGEARKSIQGNSYNTIEALIERLKNIYSPTKSVYQLQGELGAMYMWTDENVLSYASRIMEGAERIVDAHKINNKNKIDEGFLKDLEKTVVECFIRGLRPELEIRVGESNTLQGITDKALEVERRLAARAELRKEKLIKPTQKESDTYIKKEFARTHKINLAQEEIIICQFCGKRGHVASSCFQINKIQNNQRGLNISQQYTPQNNNYNWRPQNQFQKQNQFLQRQNQFRNFQDPNQFQQRQNQFQQSQNQYQRPQNQFRYQSRDRPWDSHKSQGRSWTGNQFYQHQNPQNNFSTQNREFPQNNSSFQSHPNPTQQIRSNLICNYCKKEGHELRDCRKRIYNNDRQQSQTQPQNQENYNSLPQLDALKEAQSQN